MINDLFYKCALCCAVSICLFACDDDENDNAIVIPSDFEKALLERYPSAEITNYEDGYKLHQFEFTDSTKNQSVAWFNDDKVWTLTRTKLMNMQQLPKPVKVGFYRSQYAYENITGIDRTVQYNMAKAVYTLHFVKNLEWADSIRHVLFIDEDGTILETLTNTDDELHWYSYLPAENNDSIAKRYKGAQIIGVAPNSGPFEYFIMHENKLKKVFYVNLTVWTETLYDLDKDEKVPENVLKELELNYPDYTILSLQMEDDPYGHYYFYWLKKGDEKIGIRIPPDVVPKRQG